MNEKQGFFATLHQLRWDDHRYYHHSRINQALHLLSASSFVCAYVLVWTQPAVAVLLGWIVGMTSRQAGHFFFEPRDYDDVNHATHDHKEDIKVGYNLQRKVVLMTLWAVSPALLYFSPTLFGLLPAPQNTMGYLNNTAILWLAVGLGGLLFRTVQLFFLRDVQTGLAWAAKIITDPFHDIMLYWKSPVYLLRGELIDPMHHVRDQGAVASGDDELEDGDAVPSGSAS